jgi:ABC-type uncharacterized transport system permease subunit
VVTDYLLRRTQSLQIARSLLIALSWILAVAGLVPAIFRRRPSRGWQWFKLATPRTLV